ncbi:iron ABC transporter permease [Tessaracoccus sp. SD287]|uniref:iron ABC transporter permease n=1 Tax=Tessaracoccus sp. SD287 TaxID=2782008 RepID=UPI001A9615C6|nr:iron ABC transporter permease [Tessaracoccus sp. SD287]MBO1032190.1 iron ABC transporter permease [Tessaracoccus sp. SD287]
MTHSSQRRQVTRLATSLAVALALLALLSVVHLTQGTADVGPTDVWQWAIGSGSTQTSDIVLASRIPRLATGLLVGIALGVSGATLQSVARNPLASPDTLAVNAGAYLALALVSVSGIPLGLLGGTGVALVGGLGAAALAFLLAGSRNDPARLVLGGSVLTMALMNITAALQLVFSQETQGLFAWGAGSLSQADPSASAQAGLVIGLALLALLVMGGQLDVLGLGDDQARALGVKVVRTRLAAVVLAVLLAATAVALAGPLGFVGLCAPALVRLSSRRLKGLHRHRWLLPATAITGALLVIGSDVLLRAVIGASEAARIPTGVVTTLLGAVFLVALSQGMRTGRSDATAMVGRGRPRLARVAGPVTLFAFVLLAVGAAVALLAGDGWLLLGDVWNWLLGQASGRVSFMLDTRWPRVAAAIVAGMALALAGTLTQAVTRNALADPSLLGVSAGAGAGALSVIVGANVLSVEVSVVWINTFALAGALVAGGLLMALGARGGFDPTRLVLVGLGLAAGFQAIGTLLVVSTDPWNQTRAITWLGGSTYSTVPDSLGPVALLVMLVLVGVWALRNDLNLVQLDPDTPRLLGVHHAGVRGGALLAAVLLTGAATAAVGVIGFVGLVAPHLARLLVGPDHRRMTLLSVALGGLVVLAADTVARSALAPAQLPVGLVCALVGAPLFWWLLMANRAVT